MSCMHSYSPKENECIDALKSRKRYLYSIQSIFWYHTQHAALWFKSMYILISDVLCIVLKVRIKEKTIFLARSIKARENAVIIRRCQITCTGGITLTHCGIILRHKSKAKLNQVMACCLATSSHYQNQCWAPTLLSSEIRLKIIPENYWHIHLISYIDQL